MTASVRLDDVAQEMDIISDQHRAFLNTRTGEFVLLTDDDLGAAEEGDDLEGLHEWQQEIIRKAVEVVSTDDYRHQAFREIAVDWLESHQIPYTDENEES